MRMIAMAAGTLLLAGCAMNDDMAMGEGDMAGATMAEGQTAQGDTAPPGTMSEHGEAHAHMGHVSDAWQDTPDGMGFLPTARAEAEIAAQHAALAAERPDDMAWMQMHAGHVINALDPSMEMEGPGLGYGVRAAADNVAKHINFASEAEDASDNVKLHAQHVATSAGNVSAWSEAVIERAEAVQAAGSAEEAAPLVMEMQAMTDAILNGMDANGDGQATWEEGEGGIAQAEQHMGFMRQGEGMS